MPIEQYIFNHEHIFHECQTTALLYPDRFQHRAYSAEFGYVLDCGAIEMKITSRVC